MQRDFLVSGVWYYPWSIFVILTGITNPLLSIKIFLNRTAVGLQKIKLRKSGLQFQVRSSMDVWSVKETLLDRFYERCGIEVGENWVVVDIGAGIGDFSILAASRHPGNRVIAFEPFRASYELLLENIQENQLANIETYPIAISAKSGVTYLSNTGEPLQIQSGEYQEGSSSMQADCLSLVDALNKFDIGACDLLKLDCEGSEYDIILDSPDDTWSRIRRIVMEYHDGIVEYDHNDLVEFLQSKGYRVSIQPNYVHANLGYLYACQVGLC